MNIKLLTKLNYEFLAMDEKTFFLRLNILVSFLFYIFIQTHITYQF